jgi:Raf kinase inhibitor-like YbhB/YbcL family protein
MTATRSRIDRGARLMTSPWLLGGRTISTPRARAPGPARSMLRSSLVALASILALAACASATDMSSEAPGPMTDTLTVTSAAFSDPLAWTRAPEGTAAFALIVDDPDARGWIHWIVADIPAETAELAEGEAAGTEGRNDFRRDGWGGPCPPSGSHRYDFTVFALSDRLGLNAGFSADQLRAAMEGSVLAEGTLSGTYRRGG